MTLPGRTWWMAVILLAAFLSRVHAITLDVALARVLENNPAIIEARGGLEQAAGRRLVLRATSLPDARIRIPLGVQGGKRAGEDEVQPFVFAQGFFAQPLFHAAIPASYRRGNLEILIAQQRLNLAIIEQLHTARIAFYTAAYQNSLRTLGEAQRERLEGNARAQADRYQAGQSDRGAVTVARLLEQELQPRIADAQRTEAGALLTLARTMGDDLGQGRQLPTADATLQFAQLQLDLQGETTAALQRRADIKLAQLYVDAAREDQRIIEAAYYPSIYATVSGDYIPVSEIRRGSEGSARRSDDVISSEIRAGAAYSWRILDYGKVRGPALQQKAAREINELFLARLKADVPRELTRLQNNLGALAARQLALERAAGLAEQTVTDVLGNLREGLSSQLEYRTAENSFLQTKAGVLSVAFEQNVARAELDRVTGRYFQFSDDTAAKLH